MTHRLPAPDEVGQLAERRLRACGSAQVGLADSCQPRHRLRQRALGIDQPFQRGERHVGGEGDGTDLDHAIAGRVQTCRLEV